MKEQNLRKYFVMFLSACCFALSACKPIKVRNPNKHDPGPPPEVSAPAQER